MSATCKYCGRPIVWAKTRGGKVVPLNPAAPTYEIVGYKAGPGPTPEMFVRLCEKMADGTRQAMLLHHYDCKEYQKERAKKGGKSERKD